MDVYYMDISGRRTLVHCSRLDFRLRGVWVDENVMFIKYENIIKVVCYNGENSKRTKDK